MKFDRTRPGGGVEIACRIENGKARLTWEFYLKQIPGQESPLAEGGKYKLGEQGPGFRDYLIDVAVTDGSGHMVLRAVKLVSEEEPLESLLLHPHLWNGVEDPYLYHVNIELLDLEGRLADRICINLPLRETGYHPQKGLLLNKEPFVPRVVRYVPLDRGEMLLSAQKVQEAAKEIREIPQEMSGAWQKRAASMQIEQMLRDLQLLREMGANAIYCESMEQGLYRTFIQMCDKYGFLIWEQPQGVPCRSLAPGKEGCLLDERNLPSSLYYRYRAMWGREPFVYIVPESIRQQKDGDFTATVYSNGSRVALYIDGFLHGFQTGEQEFVFEGISARYPCIALGAEAEGCSTSLSLHKTYVKHALCMPSGQIQTMCSCENPDWQTGKECQQ